MRSAIAPGRAGPGACDGRNGPRRGPAPPAGPAAVPSRAPWRAARSRPARHGSPASPAAPAAKRSASPQRRPAPAFPPSRAARAAPGRRRRIPYGCSPSHLQALDHAAVLEVLLDDLVDVGAIDVGVPDRVRVDHDAGAFLAAVEAARLVDADLAFTGEAELLDAALGVVADLAGALVVAADPAAVALVAAEEHVLCVIGHTRF